MRRQRWECTVSWDRQTARKLIKNHVARRGSKPVTLTERLVRYWWRALNVAVFGGKLPALVGVSFVRHKGVYAWAHKETDGRMRLSLQPTFTSRQLFLMVLVHEMVHGWEHAAGKEMTHGPQFYGWKERIIKATDLELKLRLQDV